VNIFLRHGLRRILQRGHALTRLQLRAFFIVVVSVLGVGILDQTAKWVMLRHDPFVVVPHIFSLHVFYNSGIALSIPLSSWVLALLMVAAFVLITQMFADELRKGVPLALLAYGLLVGGALSNIIDRLRVGAVIDYLEFFRVSVLNMGDLSIFVGLLIFFWLNVRKKQTAGR